MKKQALSLLIVLVLLVTAMAVMGQAETTLPEGGAYVVALDGTETAVADPMTKWADGQYEYIKLYAETALAIPEGTEVYVDLNGQNLTVTGEGTLQAFNSANDGYSAAAGAVTNNGTVEIITDVTAPISGYRYLALTEGKVTTVHRISMRLRAVTLRTDAAGLYYKALYNCDDTLAAAVKEYGVILSLNNMPGADFAEETDDINKATAIAADATFGDGTEANSGSVFGIMKKEQGSLTNYANANMKIYANAYIRLDTEAVIVADTANVGLSASNGDFDGTAYSLRDTVESIDSNYYAYAKTDRTQIEQFRAEWKSYGMRWALAQIGNQKAIDNSNLELVDGVAYCPVCEKDVTWTPIVSQDTKVSMTNGGHYYLAEVQVTMNVPNATKNATASNSANGAILAPDREGQTACLHLNGNKLLAQDNSAIFAGRGTLNVMGEGEISGSLAKTGVGDAIQVNRTTAVVNLYGGHYTKETEKGYVIALSSAGGTVNVYEAATFGCKAEDTGYDIFRIGNGTVALNGVDLSNGLLAYASTAEKQAKLQLWDSKIGSISMNEWDALEVWGESTAKQITLPEDAKLTLGQLAPTASIGVKTDGGIITEESAYAEAGIPYIKPSNTYQRITLKNGALRCEKDYVTSEPVQQGYCPACQKSVTWTAVTGATALASGDHYYLPSDQLYASSDASFVGGPTSGTACFHLNGYDITATAAKAIFGSGGTLNVMGTGTVTGYTASTADSVNGAAVQINNTNSGTVNLYSGTYQQYTGTHSNSSTVCIRNNGGKINIYEDAKILSNITGKAIYTGTAAGSVTGLGLYGTEVTGDVHITGALAEGAYASTIALDNATVSGEMIVSGINTLTLGHATKIDYLKLAEQTVLTLGKLTAGADITVHTNGQFTEANTNAAAYAAYFTAFNPAGSIAAENNILVYSVDYSLPLSFTEGTTGMCPLCEIEVEWTELKADEAGTMVTLPTDGHYYLATPQTFTSSDTTNQYAFVKAPDSGAACLHLNGQNLTATNAKAIYGNAGVLNVLGSGEVAGYSSSANTGAAIQVNSGADANAINLYSGTYKRYNSGDTVAVVAIRQAGLVNIHKGATIEGGTGTAIYLGRAWTDGKATLNLYGSTVNGNLLTELEPDGEYLDSTLYTQNATINGTVDIKGTNNVVTFEGKTVISQLNIAEGLLVNFVDMMEGSSVKVSATGTFTPVIGEADHYAAYFTTGDEGDWVICKDYTLYQEVKTTSLPATEDDKTQLESLYEGRAPYHGELHNHTKTENLEGVNADGNNTLEEWVVHMEEKRIDFATIVDHKQSTHMYQDAWDDACFIGGSEPAVPRITDLNNMSMHFNMVFADVEKLEAHLENITEFKFTKTVENQVNFKGGQYSYYNFTTDRIKEIAQSVIDHGGFFVHVHPKANHNYIVSDDPEDYFFGEGTGIEVSTTDTSKLTMAAKYNVEAYELWVDLLERDHRVFATLGDDNHLLSDLRSLSTVYSAELEPQAILDQVRAGDLTAGPVGIRMSIGDTAAGGITTFDAGKRLVLSVGDIHESFYQARANHKFAVEVYDDGGIIFTTEIDPSETTYFAMDIDTSRKFYRAVVVDLTEGCRIAVGNPVFNSAKYPAFAWLGETAE